MREAETNAAIKSRNYDEGFARFSDTRRGEKR